MKNINDYDIVSCQEYCKQLPFFNQLLHDFDELRWEKQFKNEYLNLLITPREQYGIGYQVLTKKVFVTVPFFYLRKLLEKNPDTIYDLGCGWNIFKKYIPNIIGVSPTHNIDHHGDIHDVVDVDYIKNHQNYFESVFSINALHFRPLNDLKNIVNEFVSMVKPAGRGFLSLNLMRLIERTSDEFLIEEFGNQTPSVIDYDNYIRSIISQINVNYLIVDVDLTVIDEYMDGNIRLVFEKHGDINE